MESKKEIARKICNDLKNLQTEVYNFYVFGNFFDDDKDKDIQTDAMIHFSDDLTHRFQEYFKKSFGIDYWGIEEDEKTTND